MKRDKLENYILGQMIFFPDDAIKIVEELPKYRFHLKAKTELFNIFKKIIKDNHKIWDWNLIDSYITKENRDDINGQFLVCANYTLPGKGSFLILMMKQQENELILGNALMQGLNRINEGDDIMDIVDEILKAIDKLYRYTDGDNISANDIYTKVIGMAAEKKFVIDDPLWNKKLKLARRNIYVLGGKGGSFKTKFVAFIIKRFLLEYTDNLSVMWANLEDPSDKLIRTFASEHLLLTEGEIEEKVYLQNDKLKKKAENVFKKISEFDIEFTDRPMNINDIRDAFHDFYKKRPKRLSLLIVDNIMSINEVKEAVDEAKAIEGVMKNVDNWNIKLTPENISVFMLHHLTKMDKNSSVLAFRPDESSLRGTSRTADIPTVIILINAISNYPKLYQKFTLYSEYVKRIFIVEISKSRNTEPILVRYIAFPEYSTFIPLD